MAGTEDFDFDLENALEVDRAEEFEDNLDVDIDEPAGAERGPSLDEIDAIFEGVDGVEVFDGNGDPDFGGEELEYAAQDVPERDLDHSQDLDDDAPWREETTVTDGRHVLDEFGEDVSSSPLREAEATGDDE